MSRAVIYARVSQSNADSTSVQGQIDVCERWASAHGHAVHKVYRDDGVSGAGRRQAAQDAIADVRTGRADVLVVDKLDRLSREGSRVIIDVEDMLKRPGARFVAFGSGLDSEAASFNLTFGILAAVARGELENTSARYKAAQRRLLEARRWRGGPAPYGFVVARHQGGGKVLHLDLEQTTVIRRIAADVLAGKYTARIARELNAEGVAAPRAQRWSGDAVRRLVCSPLMRGQYLLDRGLDVLRGDDGLPLQVWPEVLDATTWRRVRAALRADEHDERRREKARIRREAQERGEPPPVFPRIWGDKPPSRVLSGVLRCGRCGGNLGVRTNGAPSGAAARTFYECHGKRRGQCRGVMVAADRIEPWVESMFLTRVGHEHVQVPVSRESGDAARLVEVRAALEATLSAIREAYTGELGDRLACLQQEERELAARDLGPVVEWIAGEQTYAEAWREAEMEVRNDILRANLSIVVAPAPKPGRHPLEERLRVWWRPAFVEGASNGEAGMRRRG